MAGEIENICPGCGARLIKTEGAPNHVFNASLECIKLFYELSGRTLTLNRQEFLHQLVVDSYSAQHPGGVTKNITVAFALIGLCLVVEHQYT